RGDYLFAWLGATTPFSERVWKIMAQLGSRLFFWQMGEGAPITVDDLVAADEGVPYKERLSACREAVHRFLTQLQAASGGVRGVVWEPSADPRYARQLIAQFSMLLARMRSDPDANSFEQPHRANAVLSHLARGHALVHGRRQLDEDDLRLIA